MKSRKLIGVIALAAVAVVAYLLLRAEDISSARTADAAEANPEYVVPSPIAAKPKPESVAPTATPFAPEAAKETHRDSLPTTPLNAHRKPWVRGSYGSRADQFGRYKNEAEAFTPQGFVVTPNGELLVLDTGKKRLLFYSPDGRLLREMPLPADLVKVPADVAVGKDGTIIVMDHLKGMVLLDADGKLKAQMPKPNEDGITGMYTVGDDVMTTVDGMTTVKAGDITGVPDDTTKNVHFQEENGRIPGHVAPDGTTVLSVGFDDVSRGDFWVHAMRGSPGQEVFTRFFRAPGVTGIPLIQADAKGRIYLVVNTATTFALMCLDGKTGTPVGMVEMPVADGSGGRQFRMFNVVPSGGVIYQEAYPSGVTYEYFNCHP